MSRLGESVQRVWDFVLSLIGGGGTTCCCQRRFSVERNTAVVVCSCIILSDQYRLSVRLVPCMAPQLGRALHTLLLLLLLYVVYCMLCTACCILHAVYCTTMPSSVGSERQKKQKNKRVSRILVQCNVIPSVVYPKCSLVCCSVSQVLQVL